MPNHSLSLRRIAPGLKAAWGSAVLLAAAFCLPAAAQTYPDKPIRMIVPFPAGGTTDILARIIGEGMTTTMGQSIIVDNRGGASGMIGVDALIKSPADGYTFGQLPSPTIISALVNGRDWNADNDMTAIGLNYRQGILLAVNPTQPLLKDVRNPGDLFKVIRENPGKVNFGTIGIGTTGHLLGELMAGSGGLNWVHLPYKGAAALTQDVVAGQEPIVLMGASADDVNRFPGRVLLIGTSGARRQSGVLPVAEFGFPGLDATTWGGYIAPGRLPAPVAARLVSGYKAAFDNPQVQDKAGKVLQQEYLGPAELTRLIKDTQAVWGKVIKDKNIKP